jgi:hypothetical protein
MRFGGQGPLFALAIPSAIAASKLLVEVAR